MPAGARLLQAAQHVTVRLLGKAAAAAAIHGCHSPSAALSCCHRQHSQHAARPLLLRAAATSTTTTTTATTTTATPTATRRYQLLAGVIEERGIETIFKGNYQLTTGLSFIVRTANTFLGSLLWVDFVRLLGMQKSS